MQAFNANGGRDKLCWSSEDPRESMVFGPWGPLYRFAHDYSRNVTECYRTSRGDKEDRVARFEWGPNGALGRVSIGKISLPMIDLCNPLPGNPTYRSCIGPDGLRYQWAPSTNGVDVVLQDPYNNTIACMHPIRPTRYPVGKVYYEFYFYKSGNGGALLPPVMDIAVVTAMLYRYCSAYGF
ncbi:hypothetical protein ACEPAF_6873 [Sanghuangporus sanghuang]|uniref:DUF6593 domain-containing protein n=1 Tax=Sanghuangporus baumii TaxID=108892 RepID=A0A9Q5N4L1_SANBA|nr:hypothetical protein A7U60_g8454 [Sanghuangporus baumii]